MSAKNDQQKRKYVNTDPSLYEIFWTTMSMCGKWCLIHEKYSNFPNLSFYQPADTCKLLLERLILYLLDMGHFWA